MGGTDYYKDKISLVTGANSGIGYALTEELLKRGAIVYMAGRNPDKIEKAAKNLSKYRDSIHTVIVDVTVQKQVKKAIQGTAEETGRLDFLFNNAGVAYGRPFETATLNEFNRIIEINLWSVIYGVHAAIPIMLEQGHGHIINTSSLAGIVPPPYNSLYTLTKYGVTGFTESLRYEYKEQGLNFSTICPAHIITPLFDKISIDIPDDAIPADQAAELILNQIAAKRGIIFVPEELENYLWREYVLGNREDYFLQMARERKELFR